jgi:hypothetical protein
MPDQGIGRLWPGSVPRQAIFPVILKNKGFLPFCGQFLRQNQEYT